MNAVGKVRPMVDGDMPGIAALYEHVHGLPPNTSRSDLHRNMRRVFLEHPWQDERIVSLVVDQPDDRIIGCLGVVPRPMLWNGKKITAAVSHSFVVAPELRSGMAALELVRAFLAGKQDLSICQGNEVSRRIWDVFGGSTSHFYSLGWTRPLHPARYLLSYLRRRSLPRLATTLLKPLCTVVDMMAPRMVPGLFRLPMPEVKGGVLTPDGAVELLVSSSSRCQLRPVYTSDSYRWMLDTLALNPERGALRAVLVHDRNGVVGWYIYHLRDGEIAEVVQIGASNNRMDTVFEHLLWQARGDGAIVVTGQLEPALLHTLNTHACLLHQANNGWMLLHARNREILDAVHEGRACLSRMEAEWWISELLR